MYKIDKEIYWIKGNYAVMWFLGPFWGTVLIMMKVKLYFHLSLFVQVEQLTSELAIERSNAQKVDAERASLDRQNKDLKAKISELDSQLKSNRKAAMQALESRIANLEEQLEAENR